MERLGLKGEVKPEDFVALAKNQVPGKPNEPLAPGRVVSEMRFITILWAVALLRCPLSERHQPLGRGKIQAQEAESENPPVTV